MDPSQGIFLFAVVVFTATAMVTDLRTRTLPNWLTVSGAVIAILFHVITAGWAGLGFALGGFAVGFGILLVLWLIGGGGGGDVKLMGAVGAWLGPQLTLAVFLLSTLFALFGSIAVLAHTSVNRGFGYVQRRYIKPQSTSFKTAASASLADQAQRTQRRLMPYALPVALGTWLVLAWKVTVGT